MKRRDSCSARDLGLAAGDFARTDDRFLSTRSPDEARFTRRLFGLDLKKPVISMVATWRSFELVSTPRPQKHLIFLCHNPLLAADELIE